MGRAARKDKKKAGGGAKRKEEKNIPELVARAEACVGDYDFEGALKLFEQALQLDPNSTPVLDAVGEVLLEMGEHEKAKAVFIQSVQLAPEGSFATYMYLGQLMNGTDAVACFDRGSTLLLKEMEGESDVVAKQLLGRKLSSALCARAELYMTDLCDDPQAEAECSRSLSNAVEHDPTNPDAWVAKANFHICQQDAATGLQCLDKAVELVEAIEDDDALPPFEVRLSIGKMYVELAEHAKVTAVLEDLLAEDDEHIEVLFMLSVAYKELGEVASAQECAEKATVLFAKLPPEERSPVVERKITELVQALQNTNG